MNLFVPAAVSAALIFAGAASAQEASKPAEKKPAPAASEATSSATKTPAEKAALDAYAATMAEIKAAAAVKMKNAPKAPVKAAELFSETFKSLQSVKTDGLPEDLKATHAQLTSALGELKAIVEKTVTQVAALPEGAEQNNAFMRKAVEAGMPAVSAKVDKAEALLTAAGEKHGLAGLNISGKPESAKKTLAQKNAYLLDSMVQMYQLKNSGRTPADLQALVRTGLLTDDTALTDPWGNPMHYRLKGVKNLGGCDIYSWGPDKQDGTADDIGNWSTE